MTFEEEFPSLKGGGELFTPTIIKINCLDKVKIKAVIEKYEQQIIRDKEIDKYFKDETLDMRNTAVHAYILNIKRELGL